ncbi:hypothetical protein EI94DRAFT_1750156 [Lactarius quietus]|nr:hypothetical protein EI94DRAFT_1750156 [Lactarius quietus]
MLKVRLPACSMLFVDGLDAVSLDPRYDPIQENKTCCSSRSRATFNPARSRRRYCSRKRGLWLRRRCTEVLMVDVRGSLHVRPEWVIKSRTRSVELSR